jgi:hypothetical protein
MFPIDTFYFDKLVFRSDIGLFLHNNSLNQNDYADSGEKESKIRTCQTRICLQTRNGRTIDRSLQDHCKANTSKKGGSQ